MKQFAHAHEQKDLGFGIRGEKRASCDWKRKTTVPLALPHTGFSLHEELDFSPLTSDKTGWIN